MKSGVVFRSARLAAMMAAAFGMSGAAHAQYQQYTVKKVGAFDIIYIKEKGVFSRCAATMGSAANMLRLAWTPGKPYSISVPPAPAAPGKPLLMTFKFAGGASYSFPATTDGKRAWTPVNNDVTDRLMAAKQQIVIDLGMQHFVFPIGNTNMNNVFVEVENCSHAAMGH